MRALYYTTTARRDLGEISLYIADESGSFDVANAVIDKIDRYCGRLASLPGTLGSARSDLQIGLRSTPCQGYVIFFRYGLNSLEIISILHGSRDVVAYFDEG